MTFVYKRDGRKEKVFPNKITTRLDKLIYGLDKNCVIPQDVTQKVVAGVYNGITTMELDNLAAETAAYLTTKHPDYAILAARIAISNLHKETKKSFSQVMSDLYNFVNPKTGKRAALISQETYDVVSTNAKALDEAIIYNRDFFNYNYFGFKTLERSYLLRLDGRVVERPQHLIMRVAVGIHGSDLDRIIETYNLMSERYFTHATPTLFNAGTPYPQLSSCFLVCMKDDSIEGIYDTLKNCAMISKSAGGIGLSIHNIRATGSYIAGTNGYSNGIVPMLRAYDATARYVDQGGNKRPGAFAIYLEPWHADIFEFIDLRKNHGKEQMRARDLFLALWIPDLFMKRVKANGDWSLFCPNEAPGLHEVHSEEFEILYEKYEKEGRARKTIPAQKLWHAILEAQIETGTPFMLYKDAANSKSNQKNLGTIKSSNLCTEIIEYSSPDETAVCNLASVSLPSCISDGKYDFQKLHDITKVVAFNLNRIIDVNYYPIPEARRSNMRHRPIGVGVQGLADTFQCLRIPFDSAAAKKLNQQIFETIYHGALEASAEMAETDGPYETFQGSPASLGQLQYDMWGVTPSSLWDWDALKAKIAKSGLRNSLVTSPMPTASTSQIMGNNECFEPYTSNIHTRRVLSREFQVVCPWLLRQLVELGLWDEHMKNMIIAHHGSVQNIPTIPDDVKTIYKTVWEISPRKILELSADRGAFICQSQSLNVHLQEPTLDQLTRMHFYGWKRGLKTGMYYLRTKPAAQAIQFTVDQSIPQRATRKRDAQRAPFLEQGNSKPPQKKKKLTSAVESNNRPSIRLVSPASPQQSAADMNEFLNDLDLTRIPPELKKEGSDWSVMYNPKLNRKLDVSLVHTFHHSSPVSCVQFSGDGKYLATGCNATARIFDVQTGQKICVLFHQALSETEDLYIRSVRFSPDGRYLATGADERIWIWDIVEKKQIRVIFEGHHQDIYSLEFSLDGRRLVSGSDDASVRIWDMDNYVAVRVLTTTPESDAPHDDAGIMSVAISSDDAFIAAGCRDKLVRVWAVDTGALVEVLRGHQKSVYSVVFTRDGGGLVSGAADKTIRVWDLRAKTKEGVPCTVFTGHTHDVMSVGITRDAQWIVSGSWDRGVHFWDTNGVVQCVLQGHKSLVFSTSLHPVNNLLATGSSGDNLARIWSYDIA